MSPDLSTRHVGKVSRSHSCSTDLADSQDLGPMQKVGNHRDLLAGERSTFSASLALMHSQL
jgi:hypothetical protein